MRAVVLVLVGVLVAGAAAQQGSAAPTQHHNNHHNRVVQGRGGQIMPLYDEDSFDKYADAQLAAQYTAFPAPPDNNQPPQESAQHTHITGSAPEEHAKAKRLAQFNQGKALRRHSQRLHLAGPDNHDNPAPAGPPHHPTTAGGAAGGGKGVARARLGVDPTSREAAMRKIALAVEQRHKQEGSGEEEEE